MSDQPEHRRFDAIVRLTALAFAAVVPLAAHAGEHLYRNDNAAYRTECGSCHIAYPPALLGVESWRQVMNGLDRHFGTDAGVSDAKRSELLGYLEAAAGRRKASGTTRITEAGWFRREHAEIAAPTWKSTAVRSSANCEACHRQAAAGDFSERNIRMPTKETR